MYLEGYSSYIDGLVNMASSCSEYMMPSYMRAICFKKKNYKKAFCNFYKIPEKELEIIETSLTLKDFINQSFGNIKEITEGLTQWLHMEVGDYKKVLTVSENSKVLDLLSGSDGGIGGFYTVEDIYFIEFDKMIVCFIIGNDE